MSWWIHRQANRLKGRQSREEDDAYPWRIGHYEGLVLAAFPTQAGALLAAAEVAAWADWTRSTEDLQGDPDVRLITRDRG
ncbi:hypothetical protein [Streptomyces pinistramenti]|uniref:hypothetical protein n=1 Tax=Streptomyces pinistramenti TaxID=2884812 RepID=UPI001D073A00|nr:hypothetical protein [Streptomyces pinistramenti]MCB5910354.1 hypothetical protein [Streptomyces pinistramenti]